MSSSDQDDIPSNPSKAPHFNEVVRRAVSRRGFLKAGLGASAVGFMGAGLTACGGDDEFSALRGDLRADAVIIDHRDIAVRKILPALAGRFVPAVRPVLSTGKNSPADGNDRSCCGCLFRRS